MVSLDPQLALRDTYRTKERKTASILRQAADKSVVIQRLQLLVCKSRPAGMAGPAVRTLMNQTFPSFTVASKSAPRDTTCSDFSSEAVVAVKAAANSTRHASARTDAMFFRSQAELRQEGLVAELAWQVPATRDSNAHRRLGFIVSNSPN